MAQYRLQFLIIHQPELTKTIWGWFSLIYHQWHRSEVVVYNSSTWCGFKSKRNWLLSDIQELADRLVHIGAGSPFNALLVPCVQLGTTSKNCLGNIAQPLQVRYPNIHPSGMVGWRLGDWQSDVQDFKLDLANRMDGWNQENCPEWRQS